MIFDNLFDALFSHGPLAPFGYWFLLGALVVFATALYAAIRSLRASYAQQGRRFSRCRLPGREVVRRLLDHLRLPSDQIDEGAPIDHYDLWRRRVRLRTESSVSSSVAALAIAAHEVGHAEQFAAGYWAARATRCLLVLLALSAVVLFVFPFAALLVGAGEGNLTRWLAVLVIFPVLRLPLTIVLERDATRRGQRLLNETGLADASEQAGVAQLLAAGFRTHVACSAGLILLVGGAVAAMSVVENSLDASPPFSMQAAVSSPSDPSEPLPPNEAVHLDALYEDDGTSLPMFAFSLSMVLAWWAFRGRSKKAPVRSAADANNEGMALFEKDDPAAALGHIDQALRQDPGLAAARYNRAVVLASLERRPEALASLEAVFACRPEDIEPILGVAELWYLRGALRLDQGDHQGAIDDLSRALDLEPADPSLLFSTRGLAWLRIGQLDRALEDTQAALALRPDDAVAYNNRGVIHRDLGNLDQAVADLRRALELDPELPNARQHLAVLVESASAKATVGSF